MDGNPVGYYLNNAGAVYETLSASWGYTVEVDSTVQPPLNTGSFSEPVASLDMELSLHVSTVLRDITDKCHVRMNGKDGRVRRVACANGLTWWMN